MSDKLFTQCRLQKITEDEHRFLVSWIPAHVAIKGGYVILGEAAGTPKQLFKVLETYSTVPQARLDQLRKNQKDHRKATDI
jgi:hypothetical protein